MKKIIITITVMFLLVASCVSKKKYLELDEKLINTKASLQKTTIEKERLEAKFGSIEKRVENYNNKINSLRDENVTLERSNLGFTDDDITVLSEKQKVELGKTLSKIDAKKVAQAKTLKDSINLAVDYKVKKSMRSAGMYSEEDININIENTVVMISVSNKLLFASGSFDVNKKANPLLQKIADVINSEPSMDVMIEGHTDSKTLNNPTNALKDNWDLSVKRATAIVRLLEKKYFIKSNRLIAAGRGSSMPLVKNNSKENRARNRRTRIVILPNLDKFFAMLSSDPDTK
ncbi:MULTISPECIES: OmpA family protein [unclassified Polaribacter]|jgi:chemotaxis protein MotB|uniref:OmpA/MotB family protein n=1 Tax=unclassified Polaribacter TaxID=196858 RepID=UPI00052E160F|nr:MULTISPECIES: OmpA family protein [unclassified Polaribacter]KGL61289.1 flagellar motor rotation protein MotB [Polaribacter sp. Hel1_33_49]MBT3741188.1 OmpA family protein [Polaribacter sp.]MBT7817080.1 OmpA family protein [Polaribacter sp.]MDG1194571.1 OmpA family protein [Polaribacter sp.]MDG1402855.1 OmpA family protein [Polaribacter sp.]